MASKTNNNIVNRVRTLKGIKFSNLVSFMNEKGLNESEEDIMARVEALVAEKRLSTITYPILGEDNEPIADEVGCFILPGSVSEDVIEFSNGADDTGEEGGEATTETEVDDDDGDEVERLTLNPESVGRYFVVDNDKQTVSVTDAAPQAKGLLMKALAEGANSVSVYAGIEVGIEVELAINVGSALGALSEPSTSEETVSEAQPA